MISETIRISLTLGNLAIVLLATATIGGFIGYVIGSIKK